ncbi:hypothetical protein [Streptomyces sp. NBC_01092]|uniref:hypothetical protein n=1 Tax=Streptomyces sp. NBC_01092 TaxID=2903748 RepID=UPI003870D96B|nr:hypothetical protein OG254_03750 [Streptomyces sp. NBC_01092]
MWSTTSQIVVPKGFTEPLHGEAAEPVKVLDSFDYGLQAQQQGGPRGDFGNAWTTLLSQGGALPAILRDLTILAASATVLIALASLALHHRLTTDPGA